MIRQTEDFDNPLDAIQSVQQFLDSHVDTAQSWILEAGCGSLSRLKIPATAKLAGIDISQKQLDRNEMLREKICGDLQTYPLTAKKFRLCICWDVIEHIPDPEAALQNLCQSLQSDGHLILALPNVKSLKGLVTQLSPHWFHVWYYRNILGIKDAGLNDTAPFKTYLETKISAPAIMVSLEQRGFTIEKLIYRDAMVYRLKKSHYALWLIYSLVAHLLKLLSLGNLGGMRNSDFIIIAKRSSP